MFNVIPAIDLLDSKVVRLKQGKYADVTFYDYSPVDLAKQFEAAGATHLHIVDLNGAKDGTTPHHHIIENIRKHTSLNLDVGGGIRSEKTVKHYLDCGVNQVIIGSLFISDFKSACAIAEQYPQQVIAGLDAKQAFIATDGWEKTSSITLDAIINNLKNVPIHSIIYTDISKDGMMEGPNIDMLNYVSNLAHQPVIASGGVRNKEDIENIKKISNISGCIIGKAILGQSLDFNTLFS